MKFFIEILREKDSTSRYLCGFIRNLDIDFEQLYEVTFLVVNNNSVQIPSQKVKLYTDENSKFDNCCYFRIENIPAILTNRKNLNDEFFVNINIDGQIIKSENSIKYI